MNYKKHYDNLMERARHRLLEGYGEWHHVIPRCMGGKDGEQVHLTPEEHYVAHQLLVKMYRNNPKLIYAALMMGSTRANNKAYGWLRRVGKRDWRMADWHRKAISKANLGRSKPAEHRAKMVEVRKKHWMEIKSGIRPKHKKRMPMQWVTNGIHSYTIPLCEQIPVGYNRGRTL
jgi:hypothetical protein